MAGWSDYAELAMLDHYFGSTNYAIPGTYYVALIAGTGPSDVDTGSTIGELSYTGYARMPMVNNTATWAAAAAGQKKNAVLLTFAPCTALSGTATYWALMDSVTSNAGHVIVFGTLNVNKIISAGDTPQIAANDMVLTLD